MTTTIYGVMTMYDDSAEAGYSIITVWSGPFASTFEARGIELDTRKGEGYLLTTYNDDTFFAACPSPRTDENYQQVDEAISRALEAHYHPLPELPYEDASPQMSMPSLYNPDTLSLHVDRDTGHDDPEAIAISIVENGEGTDIIISRRTLLTALGAKL